jgi:hypothetical protein
MICGYPTNGDNLMKPTTTSVDFTQRRHASDLESGIRDFRRDAGAWNMVDEIMLNVQLAGVLISFRTGNCTFKVIMCVAI